jgi:predicted ATPase
VIHLRKVALLPPRAGQPDEGYPFAVPAVASLRAAPLDFDAPVTFLVGENGSGKSAILEGLACAVGSIAIAGDDPRREPSATACA